MKRFDGAFEIDFFNIKPQIATSRPFLLLLLPSDITAITVEVTVDIADAIAASFIKFKEPPRAILCKRAPARDRESSTVSLPLHLFSKFKTPRRNTNKGFIFYASEGKALSFLEVGIGTARQSFASCSLLKRGRRRTRACLSGS